MEDLAQLWQAKGGLTDPSRLWSRHPTPHAVTSSERRGWTYCILDALALPFLNGQRVDIASTTPLAGEVVEVHASAEGVWSSHPEALVSLGARVRGSNEVREACCPCILTFRDAEECAAWQQRHPDVMAVAMTLEEAWRLAEALARLSRAQAQPFGCCGHS
ncbi:MAG: hypothetical protein GX496_08760 [Firmicutes bacterium]|nr:hypothetical protein [Bacillota bacterium]